jgi:monoterpene epsilon-lactone hydrolase
MPTRQHAEHFSDRAAMATLKLKLTPLKGSVDGPRARKAFDELMTMVPSASGITYEIETIGGVLGRWCRPLEAVKGAAILYFHGGGYVVGAAEPYQYFAGQIASRARTVVFVPEYRLAPEHPFPAAVEDAQAAYAGLIAQGFTKIALAGDSAGGGLALILLSISSRALAGSGAIPKGAAVISAWTDLAMTGESMKTRADADPLSTRSSLATLSRLYLGDQDARDARASPLYGDLGALPPVRMHVGEDDVLLDDTLRYGERFEQAGGTIEVHTWQGMTHVFPSNIALLEAAKEALNDIGDFLKSQLTAESVATLPKSA